MEVLNRFQIVTNTMQPLRPLASVNTCVVKDGRHLIYERVCLPFIE